MTINSKYIGNTKVVDSNGQVVNAKVVKKEVPKDYWKVSIKDLIANLGNMTPKAMQVVDYLLNNTDYTKNTLIGTNKSIHQKCHVGYTKVANTLSFLARHNVIYRKTGVIMWNPKIINHRRKFGVSDLIIQYRVMKGEYRRVNNHRDQVKNRRRTAKARKTRTINREKSKNNHEKLYSSVKQAKA